MGTSDSGTAAFGLTGRRLSRRSAVRMGLAMAALPVLAACGAQQPSAPAAPPKPAEAPKPVEVAKPTEAPKPAATAAAPAAAAPAKPAEAAKPAQTAAGTSSGRTAPPAPEFKPVKINGKLSVIIDADFHPDHNVFIEKKVKEFAEKMDYPLDFSTVAAFTGSANIAQKLVAAVQSGDPPDCITHTEPTSSLHFLEVLEDVDSLEADHQRLRPDLQDGHSGGEHRREVVCRPPLHARRRLLVPRRGAEGGRCRPEEGFRGLGPDSRGALESLPT